MQRDLNKVHNLPTLHPYLGVQFSYVMKGQYFAISKHGLYAAVSTKHNIRICMATEEYLYTLNQAIYPIENLEWCVCALYISDRDRINKDCPVDSKI